MLVVDDLLNEIALREDTAQGVHLVFPSQFTRDWPDAPDPEGKGAARAMALCLQDAGIAPEEVNYINAHGTGTELNVWWPLHNGVSET